MRIESPRPALTPPLGPEDHILGSDKDVLELVTQQVIRPLDENQFGDVIRRHVASGLRSGVNTTPTFDVDHWLVLYKALFSGAVCFYFQRLT